MWEIKDLPQLLQDYLGPYIEVIDYKTGDLGQHCGSETFNVDVRCKDKLNGDEAILKAVAKRPLSDDFSRKHFNVEITFNNEIQFYKKIIPSLQEFRKKHGFKPLSYFPEYLGGSESVILLENMKEKGFVTGDKNSGLNLEETKLILNNLADFHATGMALKLKEPNIFQDQVQVFPDGKHLEKSDKSDKLWTYTFENVSKVLSESEVFDEYTYHAVELLKQQREITKPREPFATIVHSDFTINNILIKHNKKITEDVKFIDFQTCRYQSPADDLLFFLFISVKDFIIEKSLDDLIKFYHKSLIKTLDNFQIDTNPFNFENFEEELKSRSKVQFDHCIRTAFTLDIKPPNLGEERKPIDLNGPPPISQRQKDKICLIVGQYAKKNWLKLD